MTTYYKWRVRCTTDNVDEEWILDSELAAPTTCPVNTTHTIDSSLTAVIEEISDNIVKIQEESIPTGGKFQTTSIELTAVKNTVSYVDTVFPFPISALAVEFVSNASMKGDIVSISVGPDKIIGAIGAGVSPASAWVSQNYTVGQTVTYTDPNPIYGARVYTCIVNTVSNEVPTDTTHWRHGFVITVSSTVIDNTSNGNYLKLDDLTNSDDVGRVLYVDKENSQVYVETNPTNTFSPLSPTYVRQTVYTVYNYKISEPWEYRIGESKIGGSYVPKDVVVRFLYDNQSTDTDKFFVGAVEYLQ